MVDDRMNFLQMVMLQNEANNVNFSATFDFS